MGTQILIKFVLPITIFLSLPSISFCQNDDLDSVVLSELTKSLAEDYMRKNNWEEPNYIGKSISGQAAELLSGSSVVLDSLVENNRAVVLNFWFTHCTPCIQEMPLLNSLVEEYSEKPVLFLALTYENGKEISEFLKKKSFAFEHITSAQETIDLLGVRTYPVTLILDPQLNVVKVAPAFTKKLSEDLHESWVNDIRNMINHLL